MLPSWLMPPDGLTPHGFCLYWDPTLVSWMVVSHIGIAIAYFLIPLQLLRYVLRRKAAMVPSFVFVLFAAFILLCGISHILMIATIWRPWYWLQAIEAAVTALVSLATAAVLPFVRIGHVAMVADARAPDPTDPSPPAPPAPPTPPAGA